MKIFLLDLCVITTISDPLQLFDFLGERVSISLEEKCVGGAEPEPTQTVRQGLGDLHSNLGSTRLGCVFSCMDM